MAKRKTIEQLHADFLKKEIELERAFRAWSKAKGRLIAKGKREDTKLGKAHIAQLESLNPKAGNGNVGQILNDVLNGRI